MFFSSSVVITTSRCVKCFPSLHNVGTFGALSSRLSLQGPHTFYIRCFIPGKKITSHLQTGNRQYSEMSRRVNPYRHSSLIFFFPEWKDSLKIVQNRKLCQTGAGYTKNVSLRKNYDCFCCCQWLYYLMVVTDWRLYLFPPFHSALHHWEDGSWSSEWLCKSLHWNSLQLLSVDIWRNL